MTDLPQRPSDRGDFRRDSAPFGSGADGFVQGDPEWFRDPRHSSHRRSHEPEPTGFGRLLAFTTIGALIPGAGLLAAGRRRSGGLILTLVLLSLGLAAAVVLTGHVQSVGLWFGARPEVMRILTGVCVAVGVAWVVIIVATHVALRRGRLNVFQQLVAGVLVACLSGVVIAGAARAAEYSLVSSQAVNKIFKKNAAAPILADGAARINVLLVGSDSGAGRTGVRPDTLILASIDTKTGNVIQFSLPRNLQKVPFPAGTPGAKAWPNGFDCGDACLLNAVWQWGEQHKSLFPGDDNPGLTATRQAVSATLGLSVDYYAMVNLQGFQDVIDAMGGLTINVKQRLPIGGGKNLLTGKQNPILGWIEAGTRKLDGHDALWYARSRATTEDNDRIRRQRCVISAVADQADPKKLALEFPKLANAAKNNITTDISRGELSAWVALAQKVKKAKTKSLPFTKDVVNGVDPDFEKIRSLVKAAIESSSPSSTPSSGATASSPKVKTSPAAISVKVLNGTNRSGLAARASADLSAQGYQVTEIGNVDGTFASTTVRYDPSFDESGRTLAASTSATALSSVKGLGRTLTLIVGEDYTGVVPVKVAGATKSSTSPTVKTPVEDPQDVC